MCSDRKLGGLIHPSKPDEAAFDHAVGEVTEAAVASDCVVPDFAKFLGHEEKWKIQNGCA